MRLQPSLSRIDARRLAIALSNISDDKACSIAWPILLSVAFNESSLRVGAFNSRTKDYGLMQINEKTALHLHADVAKLLVDEAYSLSVGCQILSQNKKIYSRRVPYWIGLYRSGPSIARPAVRNSAKAYDKIIRRKAEEIVLVWHAQQLTKK